MIILIEASFETPDLFMITINVEDLNGARRGSNLVAGWKGVKTGLRGHERLIISLNVAWGSITVNGQVKVRRRWPEWLDAQALSIGCLV